jgi:hypothetical protein
VIRTAAGILFLFILAGQSFPFSATMHVRGVIADASNHKPLRAAAIIQNYSGFGLTTTQDSVFSDSLGNFQVGILDSNRLAPALAIEKDGYKTQTVRVPSIDFPDDILLDTVFLVPYTLLDSVAYVISGAVTDTDGEGIRGAIVDITLSRGTVTIFSLKDTASQWGGYYNVSTRQPYQPSPVTARVRVQVPGFLAADISQTLAASTQDFVINLDLRKNPASVRVPVARSLTKGKVPATRTYTVNGRLLETAARRFPGMVVVRVLPDGSGRADIQVK